MSRRKKKKKAAKPAGTYFDVSASLSASYVFVAPLFAVYQLGLALDQGVRNGTDPIFREIFDRFRHFGMVAVNLLLLGFLLIAIGRAQRKRQRKPGLYFFMLLESLAWTGVMLASGELLARQLLALPAFPRELFASAGAGIYEEVLFRFLLMGGMILVLHKALGGAAWWVVPLAVVASALLFSHAHHTLGGEPWDRGVFWYRVGMGVVLGVLFWLRGLGIVVYAHTLYNVALVTMDHLHG